MQFSGTIHAHVQPGWRFKEMGEKNKNKITKNYKQQKKSTNKKQKMTIIEQKNEKHSKNPQKTTNINN